MSKTEKDEIDVPSLRLGIARGSKALSELKEEELIMVAQSLLGDKRKYAPVSNQVIQEQLALLDSKRVNRARALLTLGRLVDRRLRGEGSGRAWHGSLTDD